MNSPAYDRFFNGATASNGATGHEPFDYQRRLASGDSGTDCQSQFVNIPTSQATTTAAVLPRTRLSIYSINHEPKTLVNV